MWEEILILHEFYLNRHLTNIELFLRMLDIGKQNSSNEDIKQNWTDPVGSAKDIKWYKIKLM